METCSSNFVSKLTKFSLRISTLSLMSRFFLLLIVFLLGLQSAISQDSKIGKQSFTVVIDPGHGGKDSGALGSSTQEKDIVLRLALKLGGLINEGLPNIKVIYTRDTDVFIPLDQRSKIANENKANLFISLHANSSKMLKPMEQRPL